MLGTKTAPQKKEKNLQFERSKHETILLHSHLPKKSKSKSSPELNIFPHTLKNESIRIVWHVHRIDDIHRFGLKMLYKRVWPFWSETLLGMFQSTIKVFSKDVGIHEYCNPIHYPLCIALRIFSIGYSNLHKVME